MPLKIYIAYGTVSDQVTALRLQALGAVNGLSVYVPPAFTRQSANGELDLNLKQQLDNCDVVLGVVTASLSPTCRRELEFSKQMAKQTVILAVPVHVAWLQSQFPGSVVLFDSDEPFKAEQEIFQLLHKSGLKREAAKALLALGTVALGLMLFAPQE